MSALLHKSITDLTRRRVRSFFAIATLAIAVASLGIFALPTLMNRAMHDEVRSGRLADLRVAINALQLNAGQISRLGELPNVIAVEPRSRFDARVYIGDRRARAAVIGVPDFGDQRVDVVHLASGAAPATGELLADVQDANQGVYGGATGDRVRITAADGSVRELRISGKGRSLDGGQEVSGDRTAIFYATPATVSALVTEPGYTSLAFRLEDREAKAVDATVRTVRGYLRGIPGFTGFTNLPEIRAPGDWPSKDSFDQFGNFFKVITILAVLSALVLIANTITTLVAEQTQEIGIMRAIGGRRRQLTLLYVRTAMLLGAIGAVIGALLGIGLAYLLGQYFGSTFFAVDVGFDVDVGVVLASLALGVLGPALVALPAIRRGLRVELREALEATGTAMGRQGVVDHVLRSARFLPRTAQIGLRGVGRRKRRSLATAMIVGLAVGNLLAILALATSVTETTRSAWRDHGEDMRLFASGSRPLDSRAAEIIRTTPGVAQAEAALVNDITVRGEGGFVWAVPQRTLFRYSIADGRWFSAAEERSKARVVVVERNIARATDIKLGDRIRVDTAGGAADFDVIGIASNQQESGTALFAPLTTVRALLGSGEVANNYWIRTTSHDHGAIDRTATRIEDTLAAAGYSVTTEITYVGERDNVAMNRTITTSIAVFGLLIVAISMVGLASAITMGVLERTREIGILRCIGARARDLRRIFTAEGLTLAIAGWLIGIPLGYLLDRFLVWMLREVVNVEVAVRYPVANLGLALAGTVLLALLITALPVRRAARFRPGDALRYA